LDARYVDVVVRRWQAFTGKSAVLACDGRAFDDITGERSTEHDSAEAPACVKPPHAAKRRANTGLQIGRSRMKRGKAK
jgi:hypothetical protein